MKLKRSLVLTLLLGAVMLLCVAFFLGVALEVDYDSGLLRRCYAIGSIRFGVSLQETDFSRIETRPGEYGLTGKPRWRLAALTTAIAVYDYEGGRVASDMARLGERASEATATDAAAIKVRYLQMLAIGRYNDASKFARDEERDFLHRLESANPGTR